MCAVCRYDCVLYDCNAADVKLCLFFLNITDVLFSRSYLTYCFLIDDGSGLNMEFI